MWNQQICLGTFSDFGVDTGEQIRLFKQTGFDGFFTSWESGAPVAEWAQLARDEHLLYQSIHAPFGRATDMWKADEAGEAAVEELLSCLQDCARHQVPIMVVHAVIGPDAPPPGPVGIEHYGRVVRQAAEWGVSIAIENTEGEAYLDALMGALTEETVGFCWDSGHELCYNHSQDMLARYGDRLIGTHLNDNLGIRDAEGQITWLDDLHLLPFDGITDWRRAAARLKALPFRGPLTFELTTKSKPGRHENDSYRDMPVPVYLAEVYKRACRVAALVGMPSLPSATDPVPEMKK